MSKPVIIKKIHEPYAMGGNKVRTGHYISGPAVYTTGGDALTARDLGLTFIYEVRVSPDDAGANLGIPVFAVGGNPEQDFKLKIASIAGVEVNNGTDQTGKKFRVFAIGTY